MSTGSEIQSQIDQLIKSESVSVNIFSLIKICSKVSSIAQSKEEIEKYYIKNFKDVKGFFSVSYLTHNNYELVSTIADEIELQEINKDQQNKIIEVSIVGICSSTKNLTISDFKLTISNLESIDIYNIQINEKDKYREISSNKTINMQNSQVEEQIKPKQSQQTQPKRKLQIEDSDDEENKQQNKQLKQNETQIPEQKILSPKQNEKHMEVEASDEEDNDQEFIAQHLKRINVQEKTSGKKEEQTKSNTQNSNKNNTKHSSKSPVSAGNSKITSFFKKK